MNSVAQVAEPFQHIVGEEADRLAHEVGFIQRERVLSGADFVQSLILGWLSESQAGHDLCSLNAGNAGYAHGRQPHPRRSSIRDRLIGQRQKIFADLRVERICAHDLNQKSGSSASLVNLPA